MMTSRDELHRLIDQVPDALVGEIVDFVEVLRQKASRTAQPGPDESPTWTEAALLDMSARLADLESDDDPEALAAWRDSFRVHAQPCRYVPGQGFVRL